MLLSSCRRLRCTLCRTFTANDVCVGANGHGNGHGRGHDHCCTDCVGTCGVGWICYIRIAGSEIGCVVRHCTGCERGVGFYAGGIRCYVGGAGTGAGGICDVDYTRRAGGDRGGGKVSSIIGGWCLGSTSRTSIGRTIIADRLDVIELDYVDRSRGWEVANGCISVGYW